MICKNCGSEILRGKFCFKCGMAISKPPQLSQYVRMDIICVSCKTPLRSGNKFCHICGTRFEPTIFIPKEPTKTVPENLQYQETEPEFPQIKRITLVSTEMGQPKTVELSNTPHSETMSSESEPESVTEMVCSSCGTTFWTGLGKKFCYACGTRYELGSIYETICDSCGATLQSGIGKMFCYACGNRYTPSCP